MTPVEAERAALAAGELAGHYLELRSRLGRLAAPGYGERVAATGDVHSTPLRLDLSHLVTEIEAAAVVRVPLARGALRLGLGGIPTPSNLDKTGRTVHRWQWLAAVLADVYEADLDTGRDIARAVWQLHRQATTRLGLSSPTANYRLSEPCPVCHIPSLWVDAHAWVIWCAYPGCFDLGRPRWWPVDAPSTPLKGWM